MSEPTRSRVAVSCWLSGRNLDCELNPDAKAPPQSVCKLPLAMTALHKVERGTFSLDQSVRIEPSDRTLPSTYGPLQEQHPNGGFDIRLRELLGLAVEMSDNVAADIVLRSIGGPRVVNEYIQNAGRQLVPSRRHRSNAPPRPDRAISQLIPRAVRRPVAAPAGGPATLDVYANCNTPAMVARDSYAPETNQGSAP